MSALTEKQVRAMFEAIDMAKHSKLMKQFGIFRTRQTGYEFVLEELRNGTWIIIESLFSWDEVEQAHLEYIADGHTITHR